MPLILVGNKIDLAESKRKVSGEDAERLAASCGIKYFETSAKLPSNVDTIFNEIMRQIRNLKRQQAAATGSTNKLARKGKKGSAFSWCCKYFACFKCFKT